MTEAAKHWIAGEWVDSASALVAESRNPATSKVLGSFADAGLAASIWGRDIQRGHRVASKVQSGTIWINSHGRTFPEIENGGYKKAVSADFTAWKAWPNSWKPSTFHGQRIPDF